MIRAVLLSVDPCTLRNPSDFHQSMADGSHPIAVYATEMSVCLSVCPFVKYIHTCNEYNQLSLINNNYYYDNTNNK